MAQDQSPKVAFHPAPSVGHELGIMFGFIAFFFLSMAVYYALWKGESDFCSIPFEHVSHRRCLPSYEENAVASCLARCWNCFDVLSRILKPTTSFQLYTMLTLGPSHSGKQTCWEDRDQAAGRFNSKRFRKRKIWRGSGPSDGVKVDELFTDGEPRIMTMIWSGPFKMVYMRLGQASVYEINEGRRLGRFAHYVPRKCRFHKLLLFLFSQIWYFIQFEFPRMGVHCRFSCILMNLWRSTVYSTLQLVFAITCHSWVRYMVTQYHHSNWSQHASHVLVLHHHPRVVFRRI